MHKHTPPLCQPHIYTKGSPTNIAYHCHANVLKPVNYVEII